jgi:hypothetical protein
MAALGVSSSAQNSVSKKEREERTESSVFNVKSMEKLGHPWRECVVTSASSFF